MKLLNIKESKASSFFRTYDISEVYNRNIESLTDKDCSSRVLENKQFLLTGDCVLRGIPFNLTGGIAANNVAVIRDETLKYIFSSPVNDRFLIFLHSADAGMKEYFPDGIIRPMMGDPKLGENVCDYILEYADGTTMTIPVKRRININDFFTSFGENSFECVAHLKPYSVLNNTEHLKDLKPEYDWGMMQTKVTSPEEWSKAHHWIYSLANPCVSKTLVSIQFVPKNGTVFLFGITGCNLDEDPLRWESRQKMRLSLPKGEKLNGSGGYDHFDIDLGKVICSHPVLDYKDSEWEKSYNNKHPAVSDNELIVEYTANENAFLYIGKGGETVIPLVKLKDTCKKVTVRTIEVKSGEVVPVRIHIHGGHGEYIAPVNCHRNPNPNWFEDYGTDFANDRHYSSYINGEAEYILPWGEIYVEVSKGFEIQPVKKTFIIDNSTEVLTIELDRVLDWRRKGWVTADTHVHFLSPQTALLEGEAEGINVVNLLASQWGEMFTNVGDFDGKTCIGSREAGGMGEYLVRVGTENRQHVLGHISLLGYEGRMITPLASAGPDESAIGDSVAESLCGWADKCRNQNGISILPHFPRPRAEGAAALVLELIDGIEMTSMGDLYGGISPYSLSDWYRYLNCGYSVPAVGGTDKMSADTAIGTVRTYTLIKDGDFTYDSWKKSVKAGLTFVSYGPLMELRIDGRDMGMQIDMSKGGGTVDIDWHVSTVTIPVTKIELVVNGETKDIISVDPAAGDYTGQYSLKLIQSGWIALRVRGCYPGKPEIIIAHSSPVTVNVDGIKCFDPVDAMTILEQIEGTTAYIRTIGTRAEEKVYKQLLATLVSAHRTLHNRMHSMGMYHNHTAVDNHHD